VKLQKLLISYSLPYEFKMVWMALKQVENLNTAGKVRGFQTSPRFYLSIDAVLARFTLNDGFILQLY
jgi:hypothetical protein|tara:strand:- start:19015 stop:19215 length:201 start_codon:yes stop_codon:yes gene_type:complete